MRYHTALPLILALLAGQAFAQAAPGMPIIPPVPLQAQGMGSLPSVPAQPAASSAASPAAPSPAAPVTDESAKTFSFGTVKNSILFTPMQVVNMRKALQVFESARGQEVLPVGDEEVLFTVDISTKQEAPTEPATYPSFHLASVVYHAADDWTVWLNNTRITPTTNKGEVKVTEISADRVAFRWDPEYIRMVIERLERNEWAPVDTVKHRFSDINTADFDRKQGTITFALKPNQTFAAGYFHVFEGRMPAPTLPERKPADAEAPAGSEAAGAAAMPAAAPAAAPADATAAPAPAAAPAAVVHENNGVMAPATADAIHSLLAPPEPAAP